MEKIKICLSDKTNNKDVSSIYQALKKFWEDKVVTFSDGLMDIALEGNRFMKYDHATDSERVVLGKNGDVSVPCIIYRQNAVDINDGGNWILKIRKIFDDIMEFCFYCKRIRSITQMDAPYYETLEYHERQDRIIFRTCSRLSWDCVLIIYTYLDTRDIDIYKEIYDVSTKTIENTVYREGLSIIEFQNCFEDLKDFQEYRELWIQRLMSQVEELTIEK